MFSHLLPNVELLYLVSFNEYSNRNFCKSFEKKHGKRFWEITKQAIVDDLSRINRKLQLTQQVDELWHKDDYWVFKHDFSVVGTKTSPKVSGNRCLCYLDNQKKTIEVLMVFNHQDLPKNMNETQYLRSILDSQFPEITSKFC